MVTLLYEVVPLGMDVGERHPQIGQGTLDRVHHPVRPTNEIVTAVAVGWEVTLQRFFRNPATLTTPTLRRLPEDMHNRQIKALFQLFQLAAENDLFPGVVGV